MVLLLKNLLFTFLVPGTTSVYLPLLIAKEQPPHDGWFLMFGSSLIIIGACIYIWCVWDFATFGRGTPLPHNAPKKLVVRGLYRHTRNPMYLAVLLVVLGWVVIFCTSKLAAYFILLGFGFHLMVVFYEEPRLHQTFAEEYSQYCQRVGRWLPEIKPKSSAQ